MIFGRWMCVCIVGRWWMAGSKEPPPHQTHNKQAEALFDSFVPIDEEDRFNMPLEGIVDFARAIGIEDPEGVRTCIRCWGCDAVVGVGRLIYLDRSIYTDASQAPFPFLTTVPHTQTNQPIDQDVRVLVLMWKLGAKRRPGQISKEEFTTGLRTLQ